MTSVSQVPVRLLGADEHNSTIGDTISLAFRALLASVWPLPFHFARFLFLLLFELLVPFPPSHFNFARVKTFSSNALLSCSLSF